MDHGGVADTLEEVNAIDDRGESVVDAGGKLSFARRRVHLMEEAVESLPLVRWKSLRGPGGRFRGRR